MRLVVVGNLESRRTSLLQSAASRWPNLTLELVPWLDLIEGVVDLRQIVRGGDVVRIDSPGKNFEVERALLRVGASAAGKLPGETEIAIAEIEGLTDDRGRVLWPALWYRGFCMALDRIGNQLAECPPHVMTTPPDQIRVMFDKTATRARLKQEQVHVVPAIGRVSCYDELISEMQRRRWPRAFVKLAYGSSASGAIAFRMNGWRVQAFTTVEFDGLDRRGSPRMYNTRKIRELRSVQEIAQVVDAICRHVAHAEYWLPKAGINGRTFDLRVVMISGTPRHVVVRLSHTPMTNLHLLNDRSDPDCVRERCGEESWNDVMQSCRRAMNAFPGSQHAGLDLLIAADFRRHAVLEVNAFGDLLPGAMWRGMGCYEAELEAMFGAEPAAEVA